MNNFRIKKNEFGDYQVTCKDYPNIEVIHVDKLEAIKTFQRLIKENEKTK